jgi:hypothetical protein
MITRVKMARVITKTRKNDMTDDILRYLRARKEYVASDLHTSLKRAHDLSGRAQHISASIILTHAQTLLGRLQELHDVIENTKASGVLPKQTNDAHLRYRSVL